MISIVLLALLAAPCESQNLNVSVSIEDDNGAVYFGANRDVALYRDTSVSSSGGLKTDGPLIAGGNVVGANIYGGPTTINVCLTCPVNSLASAWALIANKLLASIVYIEFATGTYPTSNTVFTHPTPHMIIIRGNTGDSSQVVLQQMSAGTFMNFDGQRANGIRFSGFTLLGVSNGNTNSLNTAININGGAYVDMSYGVSALPGGMRIQNTYTGISCGSRSTLDIPFVQIGNATAGVVQGMVITSWSSVNAGNAVMYGTLPGTPCNALTLDYFGFANVMSATYNSFTTVYASSLYGGAIVAGQTSSTFNGVTTQDATTHGGLQFLNIKAW